jgi:hypothetical protein
LMQSTRAGTILNTRVGEAWEETHKCITQILAYCTNCNYIVTAELTQLEADKIERHVSNEIYDDGGGITVNSLKFWAENKSRVGKVTKVECKKFGFFKSNETSGQEWNTRVTGDNGIMYLGGFSCGYFGGTGPHGLFKLLQELGASTTINDIAGTDHVKVDLT